MSDPFPIAELMLTELSHTLRGLEPAEVRQAAERIVAARRVFVAGAGRSGLALRMVAMRLMHLGLTAFVAGDATTPAIETGDLLLVASASGGTSGPVHAAEVARKAGAEVLLVTARPDSPLGRLATATVRLVAGTRQQADQSSAQYAGALFEQSVLLLGDLLFHELWQQSGQSAAELSARHANLE